jgi:hypothetical protein
MDGQTTTGASGNSTPLLFGLLLHGMTKCRQVSCGSGRFEGLPVPEDEGTVIFRNVDNESPNHTMSHAGKPDPFGHTHMLHKTGRTCPQFFSKFKGASRVSHDEREAETEVPYRPPQIPRGLTKPG